MKINTLRKKCKAAGLPTDGSRNDLMVRLEENLEKTSFVSCNFEPSRVSSPTSPTHNNSRIESNTLQILHTMSLPTTTPASLDSTTFTTRPICTTSVQKSNSENICNNLTTHRYYDENNNNQQSSSMQKTTLPNFAVTTSDQQNMTSSPTSMYTPHTQTSTNGRYFEFQPQFVATTHSNVRQPHVATLNGGYNYGQHVANVANVEMFPIRNVAASSVSQQYVPVSTGAHYFRSHIKDKNVARVIDNSFDANSVASNYTHNFATYTDMHGQENCENENVYTTSSNEGINSYGNMHENKNFENQHTNMSFAADGNRMYNNYQWNYEQQNLSDGCVNRNYNMPNAERRNINDTPVFTPRKQVTFSIPSVPMDNFNGNEMNQQRNMGSGYNFDNGYTNVREVVSLLPEFNPTSLSSINARQFINRVELLRIAYRWNDEILIFAVQQKMQGAAKYWIDSLELVFRSWAEFVRKFINDFPCVENEADIHVKMSRTKRNGDESPQDYYYRMLAIGKRGGLSDSAISRHIINGINEPDLKMKISNNYCECSDLLRDIVTFCMHNEIKQSTKDTRIKGSTPTTVSYRNNYSDKRSENTVKCFNCHEPGHYSKNCPVPQRKPRCARCNRTNHQTENCPDGHEQEGRHPTVNQIDEPKTKLQVIVKQIIVNNATTDAFIDPGSKCTLIRESFATGFDSVEPCSILLEGFAHGKYESTGKIKLNIIIDDISHDVYVLVVADDLICENILLGRDILCQQGSRLVIEGDECHLERIMAISTSNEMNLDEQSKLQNVLNSHRTTFADNSHDLGECKVFNMDIKLTSDVPIHVKPYRIPFSKRPIVDTLVNELLDANIIRPSNSPYASGIVLVEKKNNEHRLCVDFRALNRITVKIPFPMPNLEEQFAQLAGNEYFTSLDLRMGYHQIKMDESSKQYTAFVTMQGHYEYNRMPFGLVNAPAVFQRVMNSLIAKMNQGEVLAYLDDVIIPSKTVEEGLQRLEKFLCILDDAGLTLRLDKCKFLEREISYLGHKVSEGGITPGDGKVSAIKNFIPPRNVTEVRRFLGLTGFFRKFVEGYSIISKPLTNLLRKDAQFVWGDDQQKAFGKLIDVLSSRPVLCLYDYDAIHEVHTDASAVGVAGVLLQSAYGKSWRPVFYYSRHCTPTESSYHSYELEMLAIIESLERFRIYVLGKPFRLVTDCSAIAKARSNKEMIPKIARWWMRILDYDCEILHRQGSRMSHVDALSRAPDPNAPEINEIDRIMSLNIEEEDWLLTMQIQDPDLLNIIAVLRDQKRSPQKEQLNREYSLINRRLYRKEEGKVKFVVPKCVRWRVVKSCHDDVGHFGLEKTIQRIQQNFWFPKIRKYVKNYIAGCIECCYNRAKTGKAEGQMYISEPEPIPFRQIHIDHLGPFVRSKRGNTHVLAISDAFSKFLIVKPVKSTKTQPVITALNEITSYFGLPKIIVSDRGTAFTSKTFEQYCKQNNIKHVKTAVRTPRANGQVERANGIILSYLRTAVDIKGDWDLSLRDLQWSVNSQRNATSGFSPNELVFDFKLIDVVQNHIIAAIHDDISENEADTSSADKRELAIVNVANEKKKWKARFDRKHIKPTLYEQGDLVVVENEAAATGESRKLEPKYKGPYTIARILDKDRYLIEDVPGMSVTSRKFCSVFSSDKLKPWCRTLPELDLDDEDKGIEDDPKSGLAELSANCPQNTTLTE
ncbi:uncharacterized protein LOC135952674 [Calliphora vicina]|uniref:uncharacterized protein LOC135952674 n=1 Tax=Calliphora vicina TaxID=7373 RepID=UPI00325C1AA2